ncbi:hypothetical protein [Nocardioides stalactiti]|uniref:hypothetical protein n=1 Tax=Nocardioides stalactiti TaxID=2755356 RepID=UPI001603605C|nr:hypothetical protein [Nocardioides stalactiti]
MGGSLLVAVFLAGASPASGNFGSTKPGGSPTNQVSLANDKHHRVDFFDTTSDTGNAAQWALDNQFPRLDFTWQWVDGSAYDVRVKDGHYASQYFAWVNCPDGASEGGTNPDRWCFGQLLKWDLDHGLNSTGRRFVACHELGHTVGLQHEDEVHSDSCERQINPNTAPSTRYSQEDLYQVLDHY